MDGWMLLLRSSDAAWLRINKYSCSGLASRLRRELMDFTDDPALKEKKRRRRAMQRK